MKAIEGITGAVCQSDDFRWIVIPRDLALVMFYWVPIGMVQLYWDEEAEAEVRSMDDFLERAADPKAVFAVAECDVEKYRKEIIRTVTRIKTINRLLKRE